MTKDVYRWDWDIGCWLWRRIGGYTRDEHGIIRWRGLMLIPWRLP